MDSSIVNVINAVAQLPTSVQLTIISMLAIIAFPFVWFSVSNASIMTVVKKALHLPTNGGHSKCPLVGDVYAIIDTSLEYSRSEILEPQKAMKATLDTMEADLMLLIADLERKYENYLISVKCPETNRLDIMRDYGNCLQRLYDKMHKLTKAHIKLNGFTEMNESDFADYASEKANVAWVEGGNCFDFHYIGNEFCTRADLRKMHYDCGMEQVVKAVVRKIYKTARRNFTEAKEIIKFKRKIYEDARQVFAK